MNKIRVGIFGGAGYTGGELLRLLLNHPQAEVVFVHSKSSAGYPVYSVHRDLFGDTELKFTNDGSADVDLLFLCLGHGDAEKLLPELPPNVRIIDLSQDFRVAPESKFVYGLPEKNREQISSATHIANPGCFATAIQLALLPLAQAGLLNSDVTAMCTTGSTGAGQSLNETSHFSWRQNNLSVYKPFTHQHLGEIGQSLGQLQPDFGGRLLMFPQRGSFTRGILACLHLSVEETPPNLLSLYGDYYTSHPFVHLSLDNPDLKQVVNTNKCLLYLKKEEDRLMVVSVIDNLLKGASGQAIQNMNLMFGLEETLGLKLKASAF